MEIMLIGAWTGAVWWAAWSTRSTLHRRQVARNEARLRAWERQARHRAAMNVDLNRLGL